MLATSDLIHTYPPPDLTSIHATLDLTSIHATLDLSYIYATLDLSILLNATSGFNNTGIYVEVFC